MSEAQTRIQLYDLVLSIAQAPPVTASLASVQSCSDPCFR